MRCWPLLVVTLAIAVTGCRSELPTNNTSQIAAAVNGDKINQMDTDTSNDDWKKTWDARLAALEMEFGKSDSEIATSVVPIYLGGGADVLTFKDHVDGIVYVTAGLIGEGSQKKTEHGEYELMMCFREENEWAPSLLSRLAPYTFEATLNPGDTMDIAPSMPENSTIAAFLFVAYRQFRVNEADALALLCLGITASELQHCREHGYEIVLGKLKENGVYPFTDIHRESVIP